MGSGEARFELELEYPFSGHISGNAPKEVRHYNHRVGNIGVVTAAVERPEAFSNLAAIPLSNRVEITKVGDALVMLNQRGYWVLLLLDDVVFRSGFNGLEPIAGFSFVIATDRTSNLSLDDLPAPEK